MSTTLHVHVHTYTHEHQYVSMEPNGMEQNGTHEIAWNGPEWSAKSCNVKQRSAAGGTNLVEAQAFLLCFANAPSRNGWRDMSKPVVRSGQS